MEETITWFMASWSPPAMSLPRTTWTPCSRSRRTGAVPLHRFTLDAAQWTAHTPLSAMARCSASPLWTQWAISVPAFHSPYLR